MKVLNDDTQEQIKILPMGLIEGRTLARVNDREMNELINRLLF